MAVYTEVADEELETFISRYDVGHLLSYKGIAEGVENTNFLVHAERGQFILTLYEKRVAPGDLPFFLGLMEHLAAAGLNCPTPLRDRAGHNLGTIAERPAALVSFLEGVWVRRPQVHHCAAVGEAVAKMHLAGRDFALRRNNALGPSGWRPLFERFSPRADEIASGLGSTVEHEVSTLLRDWPKDLPEGVIHADLFPDNVFFLRDRLSGLIDFYFACNDLFAYDLAICLNAWCFEPDFAFNVTKGRALFRGYQSVRKLSSAECEAMPMLARGAALRFLLTRAHDWLHTDTSALVKPHDPTAYLRRLRFHQSVRRPAEFGLEARP